MKIAGYTVLVEGESDTQTMWHLGFAALGVPGASTFKEDWVKYLDGIETVYIHKEPDLGGDTFKQGVLRALKDGGFTGSVKIFTCGDKERKTPPTYTSSWERTQRTTHCTNCSKPRSR